MRPLQHGRAPGSHTGAAGPGTGALRAALLAVVSATSLVAVCVSSATGQEIAPQPSSERPTTGGAALAPDGENANAVAQAAVEGEAGETEIIPPGNIAAPPGFVPASPRPAPEASLLGKPLERGTLSRLVLRSSESFSGARVETPIVVIRGKTNGPTVCIVAGIHGDEINGVEVVRRAVESVSPVNLKGTLIAVPIANLEAFRRGSRYLPDRRDLNRFFPGHPRGSSASRIAHRLFDEVIRRCGAVVDIHTGSFHRSNLNQLRADLTDPGTIELSTQFGSDVIVNSLGRPGTLRRAATDEGIPAITVEAGAPERFDEAHIIAALGGIFRLLEARGMIEAPRGLSPAGDNMAYLRTSWIRCDQGGILVSRVRLGEEIQAGQILGTISDPLSEEVEAVIAPLSGRLIGMALDQVVMPGYAAYHIGLDARPLGLGQIPELTSPGYPDVGAGLEPPTLELDERPE